MKKNNLNTIVYTQKCGTQTRKSDEKKKIILKYPDLYKFS